MVALSTPRRAWLAALIDGEGTVMLVRHAFGKKANAAKPFLVNSCSYRPRVGVYNTDKRLMTALVKHTGIDRVYTHKKPIKNNQRFLSYEWRVNTSDLVWLLPQVLPWLELKHKQVTLLLEYLRELERRRPVKGEKWLHVSDPTLRAKSNSRVHRIAAQINLLNRRGRYTEEA